MAQTNLWGLLAATSFGLALCGCAHEVESPSLSFDGIEPNLVCNAQRVTSVAELEISGSGFNPMPTNVLADPALLVLPSVELRKTQNLTGGAASGTEVVFSGDPEDNLGENVSWDSAEQLRIRVTEDPLVTLDDGIYDVTVKNPDGHASSTRERALAVVSPPVITSTDPMPVALCVAQGPRDLTVNGENLLVVGGTTPSVTLTSATGAIDIPTSRSQAAETCEPVPGTFAGGTLELCSTLTLTIPEGAEPVTTAQAYDFAVTSPSPASCSSSEPIKAVLVPPPTVAMVTSVNTVDPLSICVEQGEQTLTIQGTSFARVSGTSMPSVTLTPALGDPQVFTATTLGVCVPPAGGDATSGVEVCESLTVGIPPGALPAGDYSLTVTNPDPIGCSSSEPVTLTVNSPPVATAITPSSVCSGGSRVVISGQGFQTGARAELRCNAGPTVSSINTELNADGTLTVTFGPGVEPGANCEVVVINPDSCEDQLPHQTATGTEGPILFFTDPPVAPGNVNTPIFLFLTSLEPPYTVSLVPTGMTTPEIALTATLLPGRTDRLQANIPAGTAPGTYDIIITDGTGCFAIASPGVTVTDMQTIQLDSVNPTFGTTAESNAITIFRVPTPVPDPLNVEFAPTPRAFLIPQGATDAVAIQLESVTFVNANTLTAVVPDGVAAGVYDLIVVDSMGNIGLLVGAYTAVGGSLPVIDEVVPQSIVDQGSQVVTLRGSGFDGASVEVECVTSFGTTVTASATVQSETCDASGCTLVATINGGAIPNGSVCLLRVINTDGSFGEFSAIGVTNSSLKLPNPTSGTALNVGRRALVGAAVTATTAARFVYAVGGDEGPASAATPLASVEHAFVDVFGAMQSWTQETAPLPAGRSFAGGTGIGRYIYIFGGSDGAAALASGARAMVLSPEEAPEISQIDLCLTGGTVPCFGAAGLGAGLAPGEYSYRVSALIDSADPVNLGGETLASDPTIVRLKSIGARQIAVELTWSPPTDRLGAPLSGVTGYRIYRTNADGIAGSEERLLAEVSGGMTLDYIDDGSDMPGTTLPRPLGSTSAWQALPVMSQARNGPATATLRDPADPTVHYLYAMLGKTTGTEAEGGTGVRADYEFLTVTVAPNARQTVSGWTPGTATVPAGRWMARAWAVDESITSLAAAGEAWLYVGGGRNSSNNASGAVEAGLLVSGAGGQIDNFTRNVNDMTGNAGFSAVPIGSQDIGRLLAFGGSGFGTAAIAGNLESPLPSIANWPNEGLSLRSARYLSGTAVQSAFIFLIGGQTSSTAVTSSTEFVVW